MTLSLVVFDCDGVLVDSELMACAAVATELGRLGIDIGADEIAARYIGVSAPSMYGDLESSFDVVIDIEQRQAIDAAVDALLAARVTAMPGVEQAIASLSERYRICVASSGTMRRIEGSLRRASLWDAFVGRVFSASQVKAGKPAPDLFLFAAAQMGVAAAQAVVVEDSVAGVRSAKAAGMCCLGFTGGGHSNARLAQALLQHGAFSIFDDMSDLPGLVAALSTV
jgi:HAD superfamily hydrolase (TIGR01509 family)